MLPSIHLGPLMIQTPGLALLAGLWLGMEMTSRLAVRLRLSGETVVNLMLWGLGVGVAAARLGYAARFPDVYLQAPSSLFSLNSQTLDWSMGVLGGLVAMWVYARRKHLPWRPTLDALGLGLATMVLFVGIAHVFSGDAYGMPTQLPWGIELWGAKRHPTQFYEVLLTLAVLAWIGERARKAVGDGTLFLEAVGLLAVVRLFVEAFRGDSVTLPGGIRAAQVAALAMMLVVLWLYPRWQEADASRAKK